MNRFPSGAPVVRPGAGAAGPLVRVALAGLVASAAVVTASAYVGASGSGSGAASTGTLGSVTLSPAAVDDPLYPGQTSTVSLTVQNPDGAEVRISTLSLDTSQGSGGFGRSSGSASCALTTFSLTAQTNGGDGWTLAPNSSLTISLPDAVSASASTANACQNVGLVVYLKAS